MFGVRNLFLTRIVYFVMVGRYVVECAIIALPWRFVMQVAMTTNKMLKLSQQIKNEKSASERMKISHTSEVSKQYAEVKKLSLEISKLKVV